MNDIIPITNKIPAIFQLINNTDLQPKKDAVNKIRHNRKNKNINFISINDVNNFKDNQNNILKLLIVI